VLLAPAAAQDFRIEPVEPVRGPTRSELRVPLRTAGGSAPVRLALGQLRRDGRHVPLPANLLLDAKGILSWTPTPSQAGKYTLAVSAVDADGRAAAATLTLTVQEQAISALKGPVGDLLRQWHADGTAAGNTGDFYDNRDGDHSPLNLAPYPQLDQVVYTEQDRQLRRHWAAQRVLLPYVTFGNSSTSAAVDTGGSNVRFYYTSPRGLDFLYQQYRGNNLYIYPEHRDHDPGHNGSPGHGDLYPANTPYLITSQGSSGSDQPFMRALPLVLAAFRPEVKKKLVDTGLLMPTIQMLLRRTNKHLADPSEYLTGKAHPTVFEGSWVNDLKLVQAAHELSLDSLPPLVLLRVVEEDTPQPGRDYFEPGPVTEVLADTPCAIARIVRGSQSVRRLVVSAADSLDVNRRPLRFHWVVLRGQPDRIQIRPVNEAGSVVELKVAYHERYRVQEPVPIETNRVDIGVFAHNGVHYSAPAFVSFYSLDSEGRTYDASGRLVEIGHGMGTVRLQVADWNALFDLLQADTWPARLLQQALTAAERAAVAKLSAEYRAAAAESAAAQTKFQQAAAARQQALADFKRADADRLVAQKAHDERKTAATQAALEKATAERDRAEQARKQADADWQAAQKAADAAARAAAALLDQKRPGLDTPLRDRVEQVLSGLLADPTFYLEHRQEVEALSQSADAAARARFTQARKRLVALDILRPQADGSHQLHSVRPGPGPAAERLTRYERNALERFHAEIVGSLVFPRGVSAVVRDNFVDPRLATYKSWRDLYRYDAAGMLLGWTRLDGAGRTEYTADGHQVLETDPRGRPLKARSVRYELDLADQRPGPRPLRIVPGDELLYYEYASDDDHRGKIARREKVTDE
jgi:hypothetical protein